MTGKELILYILNNDLENENIFDENGIFIGLNVFGFPFEKTNIYSNTFS